MITKSELKYFYTAFMDVGKLGEEKLDEITDNAFHALTSVSKTIAEILCRECNLSVQGYSCSKFLRIKAYFGEPLT